MIRVMMCVGLLMLLHAHAAAPQHAPADNSTKLTSAQQLHEALDKNIKALVIDVRSPQEFAAGHIPGAVNIPLDDLTRNLGQMKVSKNTPIVTVREQGGRSSRAVIELRKSGYATASYCTLESWKKCGYKIETGDSKPRASAR